MAEYLVMRQGKVEEVLPDRKCRIRMDVGQGTASHVLRVLKSNKEETLESESELDTHQEHIHKIEYWMPEVGDTVVCLMIAGGRGQGYVIGAL